MKLERIIWLLSAGVVCSRKKTALENRLFAQKWYLSDRREASPTGNSIISCLKVVELRLWVGAD